jgi:DNA-3-methyladenine glycosylase
MRLVRQCKVGRIVGRITETEAYRGEEDLACHARAGRTPRTAVMYGRPGLAYIYFTYGMHWCLNVVCEAEGYPAAVLIRAIEPLEGQEHIAVNRIGIQSAQWSNGPAKLCRALNIDGTLNGCDLTQPHSGLWIEDGSPVHDDLVIASPRVGIAYAPEPWRGIPWRFRVKTVV